MPCIMDTLYMWGNDWFRSEYIHKLTYNFFTYSFYNPLFTPALRFLSNMCGIAEINNKHRKAFWIFDKLTFTYLPCKSWRLYSFPPYSFGNKSMGNISFNPSASLWAKICKTENIQHVENCISDPSHKKLVISHPIGYLRFHNTFN